MNRKKPFVLETLALRSLDDTKALAERIAHSLKNGDMILLKGELGSGKTTFARYLIQAFYGDDNLLVQSPTFTVCQLYEAAGKPALWHFDFYRLEDSEEIFNVGYEEAKSNGIVLIEWPEKMGPYMPHTALSLTFKAGHDQHFVEVKMDQKGNIPF